MLLGLLCLAKILNDWYILAGQRLVFFVCGRSGENTRPGKRVKRNSKQVKNLKARLIVIQGNFCQYCGRLFDEKIIPTIDHVTPLDSGGVDAIRNMKLACKSCNQKKANKLDWTYNVR